MVKKKAVEKKKRSRKKEMQSHVGAGKVASLQVQRCEDGGNISDLVLIIKVKHVGNIASAARLEERKETGGEKMNQWGNWKKHFGVLWCQEERTWKRKSNLIGVTTELPQVPWYRCQTHFPVFFSNFFYGHFVHPFVFKCPSNTVDHNKTDSSVFSNLQENHSCL